MLWYVPTLAYLWYLVGGEFVGWPEPDSCGGNRIPAEIWRNPEESSVNTGIPVPQEFL
jgi:hypothetical protein